MSGCGPRNKNPESTIIERYSKCDVDYRDICQFYEQKVKHIIELQRKNEITSEQSKIMLTNEYNWVKDAITERSNSMNSQNSIDYTGHDEDIELLQSMRQKLKTNGRSPRGWRALMDGTLSGMENGVRTRKYNLGS